MYYITKITKENVDALNKIEKYLLDSNQHIPYIKRQIMANPSNEMGFRVTKKTNGHMNFGSHYWDWYTGGSVKNLNPMEENKNHRDK
jgi:hypothetical protein